MNQFIALPWKDILTIGAATLGAVLGVMNTWNAMSQRRVRLRVTPVHTIRTLDGATNFAIEIINFSSFALTIEEAGFWLTGENKGRRFPITRPRFFDSDGSWPRRLQSREAVTVHFDPRDAIHARVQIAKVYARTACGSIAYGSSGALEQLRDAAAK